MTVTSYIVVIGNIPPALALYTSVRSLYPESSPQYEFACNQQTNPASSAAHNSSKAATQRHNKMPVRNDRGFRLYRRPTIARLVFAAPNSSVQHKDHLNQA